jgi:peptidoglycan hydrolase-like protein with peptidoglycan-binding domain
MGFDTGGVDGVMGVKSSSALIIFQYSQGLTVSGEVDEATLIQFEKCANDKTSYKSIMNSEKNEGLETREAEI